MKTKVKKEKRPRRYGDSWEDWERALVITSSNTPEERKKLAKFIERTPDAVKMEWDVLQNVVTEKTGLTTVGTEDRAFMRRYAYLASNTFKQDCGDALLKRFTRESRK